MAKIEAKPKYRRVAEQIRKLITKRELIPGDAIPPEEELSRNFGISRQTVREGISQLTQEGLLSPQQGRGTFVKGYKKEKSEKDRNLLHQAVRSRLLGLIIPTPRLSFFSAIISGVEDASSKNGYQIILCSANEEPPKEKSHAIKLLKKGISGLVVVTGKNSHQNRDLFSQISQRIPIVTVDIFLEGVEADYVFSDDKKGSYEAVKHLIELGHRRILHLAGPKEDSTAIARYDGYKRALLEQGIEFDEALVRETGWEYDRGYLEMKKFLISNSNEGKVAVFACNDEVASGAFKAIRERGLQVPQDVALVGFGNLDIGPLLEVPLSTVDQSPVDMGVVATGLLLERIKRKNILTPRKVVIPAKLIVRESCGAKLIGVENA